MDNEGDRRSHSDRDSKSRAIGMSLLAGWLDPNLRAIALLIRSLDRFREGLNLIDCRWNRIQNMIRWLYVCCGCIKETVPPLFGELYHFSTYCSAFVASIESFQGGARGFLSHSLFARLIALRGLQRLVRALSRTLSGRLIAVRTLRDCARKHSVSGQKFYPK